MDHEISTRRPSSQQQIGLKFLARVRHEMVGSDAHCLIDQARLSRRAGSSHHAVLQHSGSMSGPDVCPCGVLATYQYIDVGVGTWSARKRLRWEVMAMEG